MKDSVEVIASAQPQLVITFGGTADGDLDIASEVNVYFQALRKALPSAQLIALNPVTTRSSAAGWLADHSKIVQAAVEAVDGQFIDVGQPGLGDGNTLSAKAHERIAERVVAGLSES